MTHNYNNSKREVDPSKSKIRPARIMTLFLIFMAFAASNLNSAKAQNITNYSFAATSGTFTPLAGGTPLLSILGDDVSSAPIPLGFTFYYMGSAYTQVVANSNGYITFAGVPTASTANMRTNNFTSAVVDHPIIAALWDDIAGNNSIGGASARYLTSGIPGNRIFTIEYLNWAPFSGSLILPTLSFQIQLEEATNAIRFVYRQEAGTTAFASASIGISKNNSSYASLDSPGASPTVSNSTSTNNITGRPATGQVFTFTPVSVVPASPINISFTAVTSNSMTVNWEDNSTNENTFVVFRSTDNVNFFPVATVNTTTSAATGTPYSSVQTGLQTNTLYYFQVVAVAEAPGSAPLTGNQSTLPGSVCGNKIVGPSGSANYPSITAALADITANGLNCSTIIELEAGYVSSVETFPINIGYLGTTSSKTITIRPQTGATSLLITSSAIQTFVLNSAEYITIDGRSGGLGSARDLTIENTSTTGSAVQFINGARHNTLTYLNIKGVTASTSNGVVFFSTTTGAVGNNNNSINNSHVFDGATLPFNLIYSVGTGGGKANSNNTIAQNELFNFFNPAGAAAAVNLGAENSAWTVTGNSIYQTTSRAATGTGLHSGILIGAGVGMDHVVSNNFIGGSQANIGGAPWTQTASFTYRFIPINISSAAPSGINTIDGNTIGNFNIRTTSGSTTSPLVFSGITVSAGNWNIGTVTPNIIGSLSSTGNITIIGETNDGIIAGINSSSAGTVTIANNTIGSFSLTTSASNAIRLVFAGINVTSGTAVISGNTIGGTVTNSINNASANTSTTTGTRVTGITFSGATGTITNNTIQNLSYTAGSTRARVAGINISNGAVTADNNTIKNLSNTSENTLTTPADLPLVGLSMTSTAAGIIISKTEINGLVSSATAAAVNVTGIYYSGPTTGTNIISRNRVQGITLSTSSAAAVINGIHISGGVSVYRNNMVALGLDNAGASVSGAYMMNGVLKATTANNQFFFNTLRIEGSGVANGIGSTAAFQRSATGTDELINNILSNSRSNATTGGNHYSIVLNANTNFNAQKNLYWVTGSEIGRVNAIDYSTLNAWQLGTSLDATTISVNPNFISLTDSHINSTVPSPLESSASTIAGITNDFDGDSRPGPAGSVNGGGTAPDIGADEFDGIPIPMDISAFALISPATTGCYSANETVTIQIKNNSGSVIDFSTDNVTVSASVTGVNPISFTPVILNTGTIAPGATQNIVISTNYDMSAVGTYVFNGSAIVAGDGNTANDNLAPITIVINPGAVSASQTNICAGQGSTLTLAGNSGTIQWQSSIDNGATWTNETGTGNTTSTYTVTPGDTTMYRALICGTFTSNVITINSTSVSTPVASNVSRCGTGPVTLTATSNGNIYWYTTPTGTTPVASGPSYTYTASANATFYVGANTPGSLFDVGLTNNSAGGAQQTSTNYNIFTVFAPCILQGVYIYPGAAGTAILELRNNTGVVLNTATLTVTAADVNQKIWFPLNFQLPVATDLRLGQGTGSVSMYRNDQGATYPYTIPGMISITNSAAGSTYWYYAYDWKIITLCESSRATVTVTVSPADAITATASASTICSGQSSTLTASSLNTGYNYTWSPSTGLGSTTGSSVSASPSSTTTYTVTGSDASGCMEGTSVVVDVLQSPVITASAAPSTICPGTSSQLSIVESTPAQVLTVGTGVITNSNTSYPAPYGNYYFGARHQFLITASELLAAGLSAGNISSLGFDVTNTNTGGALTGFEIKMKMTAITAVNAAFETGLTTVYTNAAYTPVTGWNTHNFSTPFVWDGVSNVLIETCFNNTGYIYNASVNQSATSYASSVYYRADTAAVCSNTATSGTSNQRPNMRFGFVSALTYSWSPTASLSSAVISNPLATPATTTTYTVTVTSNNGCTSTASAGVTVNPGVTVSITTNNNVSCNGGSDGMATANSVGGSTFTYSWNTVPPQTAAIASGLSAGTYIVVSSNEFGCTDTASVVILQPIALSVTVNTTPVTCPGGSDGTATASVIGGTSPYVYTWSPPASSLGIISGLPAGTYTVTVTDANGCVVIGSGIVLDGPIVTVAISGNDSICSGLSTTLTASGASTYSWNTGDNTASVSVSPTATSTYTVTGTSASGCISDPVTMDVVVETPLTAAFTYSTLNGMDFDFSGTGGGSYSWNFGDASSGTGATVAHSYSATGVYNVVLTVANSCGSDTAMQAVVVSGILAKTASGINIYPNPSKGLYNLEVFGSDVNRITVLDVDGRKVIDQTFYTSSALRTTIDLSGFAKGVYTLRLMGERNENIRLILN